MDKTLYLDRRGLALELKNKALALYLDGQYQRTIPLGMISQIICNSSVNIKTGLLARLSESGIAVSIAGGRHSRHSVFIGSVGGGDVIRRVGQFRCFNDVSYRQRWVNRLLAHKLVRQKRFLKQAVLRRPDRRQSLTSGIQQLETMESRLTAGEEFILESLRGIEGAAARSYFRAFAQIIPKEYGFRGRNRRPPRDPVNALLSLGYTLLNGELVKSINSIGLDPWLGMYHEPMHGRPSLACDLAELYRTHIDHLVWRLLADKTLRKHHFNIDGEACLLSKEGRAIFYPEYEAHAHRMRKSARKVVAVIAKHWQTF